MPRPMRLRARRPAAGLRFERFRSWAMRSVLLDFDEVTDLPEHTGELGALRALDGAADSPQAERAQGAAVAGGLPDRATNLPDPDLRHFPPPAPRTAPRPSGPPLRCQTPCRCLTPAPCFAPAPPAFPPPALHWPAE